VEGIDLPLVGVMGAGTGTAIAGLAFGWVCK